MAWSAWFAHVFLQVWERLFCHESPTSTGRALQHVLIHVQNLVYVYGFRRSAFVARFSKLRGVALKLALFPLVRSAGIRTIFIGDIYASTRGFCVQGSVTGHKLVVLLIPAAFCQRRNVVKKTVAESFHWSSNCSCVRVMHEV